MQYTTVRGSQVEVVESFTYLGSFIHISGSSKPVIKRRMNIVREAMCTLDQNIWRSSITVETKLRLYNTCILPIFLYGAETWSMTVILSKKIHALDIWCLRRILNVHWSWICHQWAAVLVRHCPQPPSVLLWTPAPHRPLTRPLPCSTSLHYGSSWWLKTEDWPSQTILATNSGG